MAPMPVLPARKGREAAGAKRAGLKSIPFRVPPRHHLLPGRQLFVEIQDVY